ncbi:MAG: phosphoenolpyruvate--protein phosphotransferase [Neisseriaceae bacterium]|nr:phosphoenolpyruvate--protein phosphotransferase [Neisseriaceae bacterium]
MIVLHGYAAGKGIAIGRAHLVIRGLNEIPQYTLPEQEINNEIERFETAIKQTRKQLEQLRNAIPENAPAELGMFVSLHLMLLNDVSLSREPIDKITEQHINAEWALKIQTNDLLKQFNQMDDEYLRARQQDVAQLVERIQKNLAKQNPELNLDSAFLDDTILIAKDLSPADTVFFKDQEKLEGFVTDVGGPTSHTAILGRSLNIPSVIGLGNAIQLINEQEWLIVDGIKGLLIINPDELVLTHYRHQQKQLIKHTRALNKLKKDTATTQDGENIELFANIENVDDIKALHNVGADGVGLLRTEFQYLNRDTLPDEEELYQTYSNIAKKLKGKPLTIRTIDLSIDKKPRWFSGSISNNVNNPALGLTGIRLCLAEPMMFQCQIRAILRATQHGKIKIMFPMITSVTELKQSLDHLETAKQQLIERNETFDEIEIGCMIEIPSAALTVATLLKHVDFISIGTNDLIQYTLSVDRNDDSVSYLYQPAHPAVIKLLNHIIHTANRMNKEVSICGEMAGDTTYTRLLLGLGLRTFSVNTNNLLAVKEMVLHTHLDNIENSISKILRNDDPDKSENLLQKINQPSIE